MNPVASQPWHVLIAVVVLLVAWVLLRRRVATGAHGPVARRVASSRVRTTLRIVGVAGALALSLWPADAGAPPRADERLHRLAAAAPDDAPADRVQFLFTIVDGVGGIPALGVFERIVPFSGSASASIAELDLDASVRRAGSAPGSSWTFLTTTPEGESSGTVPPEAFNVDAGDGRPFLRFGSHRWMSRRFGLIAPPEYVVGVQARVLREGDRLDAVTQDEWSIDGPRFERGMNEHSPHPLARLLQDVDRRAAILLLIALVLSTIGLSIPRVLAVIVFCGLAGLSWAGHSQLAAATKLLHSEDRSRTRRIGAVALADCGAFPVTAERRLLEAFRVEPDPAVRATIVLAPIARVSWAVSDPLARQTLLLQAERDADPRVRAAVREARGLLETRR